MLLKGRRSIALLDPEHPEAIVTSDFREGFRVAQRFNQGHQRVRVAADDGTLAGVQGEDAPRQGPLRRGPGRLAFDVLDRQPEGGDAGQRVGYSGELRDADGLFFLGTAEQGDPGGTA